MRLDRVMIIARKDFSEFRKNRYIMGTVLFMPLMVAVILPMIYVVPINELGSQRGDAIALEFDIVQEYSNVTITDATIFGAHLRDVVLVNSVLQGCIVERSVIEGCTLNGSDIMRSSLRNSLVSNSNVYYPEENIHTMLVDSQLIGQDDEFKRLEDIMFNVLLILLIMIPVTIPTVTASYSFVGEKVNRSLEPLLATPITDLELLVGKSVSIFAISMAATWIAFMVAILMVDVMTFPVLGYYPLPTTYWIVGIVLLAPGMCLMSILTNVLISSKVNDVRVSQQIGGVVVLPVLIFFFSSFAGFLSMGILPLVLFTIAIFLGDAAILVLSLRVFRREEILVSWK